jgi:tripartite-type tricarboxylate transporter receptor subunit TctC
MSIMGHARRRFRTLAGALVFALAPVSAGAADLFAGKTIRIVVGFGPSSAYTLYANLAAQHLGRFIPGNPTVVVSQMPGAAGINALNYLSEVAPRDGTVITVPTQDVVSQQLLGRKGLRYDAARFNYLGRATANVPLHMVWHTAPVTSFDDLKRHEVVTGASGSGGTHADMPRAQNVLLGTRWKVITGYGDEVRIAMSRGETQAAVAAATLFHNQYKQWLDDRLVRILVQYADFRHPSFPDVPTIMDFAGTEEAKQVFKFLVSLSTIGRAYAGPPGMPAEQIAILRKGLRVMFNDPAFKADADKRGADLLPMAGEELAAYVADVARTPRSIVRRATEVIAPR